MLALDAAKLCNESYSRGIAVGNLSFLTTVVDGVTVVAFRGTNNGGNVLEDMDLVPKHTPAGYLGHGGAINAYQQIQNSGLLPDLDCHTLFLGHSLGGAIAAFFAEEYVAKCVTFGCLRPYWAAQHSTPHVDHLRFVIDNDPVPKEPAWIYKHAAESEEELLASGSRIPLDIEDHLIETYMKLIPVGYTY